MELLLTGRRMGGDETARWGRVSQVVPSDKPMSTARELAEKIAEGAPLAVKALLEILPAIDPLPLIETFDKMKRSRSGLPAHEQMMISKDFLEGLRA
jgi:crotonobetainyl-CoA hydratase